jgi:hypothetical protein
VTTDLQIVGSLHVGTATAAGGTAFVKAIPPWPGVGQAFLQRPAAPNKDRGTARTHITTVAYTTGATAHLIGIMRPFNYTWTTAAIAANGTGITLYDDPGVYSTNLKYSSPLSTGTAVVADNAIAANDYVMVQLKDGTWHVSTIASGTFGGANLVLTTAVPNITGGGVAAGAPVYFFGVIANSDPCTGTVNPQVTIGASLTIDKTWSEANVGCVAALHPGDPMLFYSPNGTNAGTLDFISGFYSKL